MNSAVAARSGRSPCPRRSPAGSPRRSQPRSIAGVLTMPTCSWRPTQCAPNRMPGATSSEFRTLGRAADRGMHPGRPPHAARPDQHEAVPVPGQPPAADPEPAGADLALEPGPVVAVSLLHRPAGGLGVPERPGGDHDRRPAAAQRAQHDDLGRVPALRDVDGRHVGAAGDDQAVPAPAEAVDPDERVKLPPVRPVDPGRHTRGGVPEERQVGAEPAGSPDHRGGLDLLLDLPLVELDELVQRPAAWTR